MEKIQTVYCLDLFRLFVHMNHMNIYIYFYLVSSIYDWYLIYLHTTLVFDGLSNLYLPISHPTFLALFPKPGTKDLDTGGLDLKPWKLNPPQELAVQSALKAISVLPF